MMAGAIREFEGLLQPDPLRIGEAWAALTDRDQLLEILVRVVGELPQLSPAQRTDAACRWHDALREWERYFEEATQRELNQCDAYALATAPAPIGGDRFREFITVVVTVARRTADDAAGDNNLQRSALARLLMPDRYLVGRVSVVVPLLEEDKGILGVLELTVLKNGANRVCQHPAVDGRAHPRFAESMQLAFEAAQSSLAAEVVSEPETLWKPCACDGVWRLQRLGPPPDWAVTPLGSFSGPSAGAAAARGWAYAMRAVHPDREVLVSAEVRAADRDRGPFRLAGVDSGPNGEYLRAKVTAFANDLRFDKLLMVDDSKNNRAHVEPLLEQLKSHLVVIWLSDSQFGSLL